MNDSKWRQSLHWSIWCHADVAVVLLSYTSDFLLLRTLYSYCESRLMLSVGHLTIRSMWSLFHNTKAYLIKKNVNYAVNFFTFDLTQSDHIKRLQLYFRETSVYDKGFRLKCLQWVRWSHKPMKSPWGLDFSFDIKND
jgi:hypothetical protein